MSDDAARATSPDGSVRVSVDGGFVAALEFAGTPDSEVVRRAVNDALLAWYDRDHAAHDALEAALQRAERLGTPSVVGQMTLADPPAWVEKLDRMLDLGDER